MTGLQQPLSRASARARRTGCNCAHAVESTARITPAAAADRLLGYLIRRMNDVPAACAWAAAHTAAGRTEGKPWRIRREDAIDGRCDGKRRQALDARRRRGQDRGRGAAQGLAHGARAPGPPVRPGNLPASSAPSCSHRCAQLRHGRQGSSGRRRHHRHRLRRRDMQVCGLQPGFHRGAPARLGEHARAARSCRLMRLALKNGLPLVGLQGLRRRAHPGGRRCPVRLRRGFLPQRPAVGRRAADRRGAGPCAGRRRLLAGADGLHHHDPRTTPICSSPARR
ncbi:MAG: hypothetical protein MZW92_64340 [Comamonadaceae bacterium]|nr:hypothetical protein [Comamonadaceae bacterium]